MWEVVCLLPDHTDTINLPPCHGNWCWWMDLDFSFSKTHAQTRFHSMYGNTQRHNKPESPYKVIRSLFILCFRSVFLEISAIPVPLFHPWTGQYSMKGSFAEHYVRAKLLMATQKPCKWAVWEAHQSSCQMRSPIIIYGHNWPRVSSGNDSTMMDLMMTPLSPTIRKQSKGRDEEKR